MLMGRAPARSGLARPMRLKVWTRPRPSSFDMPAFSAAKKSQLFCFVILIVKHRDFSRTRTTTSIQESRGFFGCDMNTEAACALSRLAGLWQEESKHGGWLGSYGRICFWCGAEPKARK